MRLDTDPAHRRLLSDIASHLGAWGIAGWVAGGFLRDAMLRRAAGDIDITLDADPLEISEALAQAIEAHVVVLDSERRHVRLVSRSGDGFIDLTPLRAADIIGDLGLRDYTVNAMAGEISAVAGCEFELLDPTGGRDDLEARLLRAICEQSFAADPLRLLRGPRLATQLDFEIEGGTAEMICRLAPTIVAASPERQREEIMRVFATDRAAHGVRLLDSLGLFPHVLGEMEVTRDVEQPKEHYFDVLGHSFAAVDFLDTLMAERPPVESPARDLWETLWEGLAHFGGVRDYFREPVSGFPRSALLKLCGLLHDIGKPATKRFQEDGRMRFFGHGDVGAEIALQLMRRLRFSGREAGIVKAMIVAHLRPIQLGEQRRPSRKAVYKFFRDTGEAGVDTLFLSLADHLGTLGPRLSLEGFANHVALTAYILQMRFREEGVVSPPQLVDGDELMKHLGVAPGPLLGRLLECVREAQAAGEVTTAAQAVEVAHRELARERRAGGVPQ